MNWIGIITTMLTVINILICLLLIFVVLLQRPKTEGLGAAFGGDTASNIFGAQTTNVLANLTRWLGGLFLGLSLIIAILGTVDPTRKSAVADFVNQRAAEKKAEEEKKKAEDEAKAAAEKLKAPAAAPAAGAAPVAIEAQAPGTPAPGTPAVPSATSAPVTPTTPATPTPKPEEAPAPKPTEAPAAMPNQPPAPATPTGSNPSETPAQEKPLEPSPTPATPTPAPSPAPAETQPKPEPAPASPNGQ